MCKELKIRASVTIADLISLYGYFDKRLIDINTALEKCEFTEKEKQYFDRAIAERSDIYDKLSCIRNEIENLTFYI